MFPPGNRQKQLMQGFQKYSSHSGMGNKMVTSAFGSSKSNGQ